jgi:hypothetical protein
MNHRWVIVSAARDGRLHVDENDVFTIGGLPVSREVIGQIECLLEDGVLALDCLTGQIRDGELPS